MKNDVWEGITNNTQNLEMHVTLETVLLNVTDIAIQEGILEDTVGHPYLCIPGSVWLY